MAYKSKYTSAEIENKLDVVYNRYFNPVVPDEPVEPEIGVIEYHFDIPMEDQLMYIIGEINGDFSEIYNSLASLAQTYGNNIGGNWEVPNDIVETKTNIMVNDDKVTALTFNSEYGQMECLTTNEKAVFQLSIDNAYYEISGM